MVAQPRTDLQRPAIVPSPRSQPTPRAARLAPMKTSDSGLIQIESAMIAPAAAGSQPSIRCRSSRAVLPSRSTKSRRRRAWWSARPRLE
jgi:hypothetical protein